MTMPAKKATAAPDETPDESVPAAAPVPDPVPSAGSGTVRHRTRRQIQQDSAR